jgi:hypothetical protein
MKRYYPKEYTSILIFLTEYGIFAYSFIEFYSKKVYKQIKNNSSINSLVEKMKSSNNIEAIVGNKVVKLFSKNSLYLELPFENDFIVYSDSVLQTSRTNKLIIHHFSNSNSSDVFDYKLCKYMFISTTLYLEYKSLIINYDIKLFMNGDNYYIVNNKIDKYVICYLLNKQLNVFSNPENCKYKLSIIDQNANIVNINENDVLYLYEDNYEIMEVIREKLENSNSEKSGESKEYEIVENENN